MGKSLRPLSEVSEVKYELFDKYVKICNPPESFIKEMKAEFEEKRIYLRAIKFMPYWMVMELSTLGYDINEKPLGDLF